MQVAPLSVTAYNSLFGTTDNYNTKQSERLHIDLAKNAYRATNRKDEYSQMTMWLERREKVQQHNASIDWRQNHLQSIRTWTPIGPLCVRAQSVKIAQMPSSKAVPFPDIYQKYRAYLFQDALADFIAGVNNPGLGTCALRTHAADTLLSFRTVRVYHNIKFMAANDAQVSGIIDAVYVRPEQKDKRGRIIPARFDTVLIQGSGQGECTSFTPRFESGVTHFQAIALPRFALYLSYQIGSFHRCLPCPTHPQST